MSIFGKSSKNTDYKKAKKKAAGIIDDPKRLKSLLGASVKKLQELRNDKEGIRKLKETIPTFNKMLRSYINGDYKKLPWKSLLLIAAGLVYFVSPIDVIPDFIPVAGYLDDMTVILWIVNAIREDVENFQEWESTYAQAVK